MLAANACGQLIEAELPSPSRNPIAQLARLFNPRLLELEDRITALENQISSYSKHGEYALKSGLGYRGFRSRADAAAPSITLDLGAEFPIETIFLIPLQREFPADPGIFPLRFTLELAHQPDFQQVTEVYSTGTIPQPPPNGVPASFKTNKTGRYVRLTVQQGHKQGAYELFGLAEFVVISKGEPVSFGAPVTTTGNFDAPGIWYPEALTDGRMPLGIWQHGHNPKLDPGDLVVCENDTETTTWTLSLDASAPIDRVVLFPYQPNRSADVAVYPESMVLRLEAADGVDATAQMEWNNPLPGANLIAPLVFPVRGKSAKIFRLTATRPVVLGERKIHALSEIEIWSQGKNLAAGLPLQCDRAGKTRTVTNLTDGYSSEEKIIPVALWLHQLQERDRVDRELEPLKSLQRQLSDNSELNTTWGVAMVLGLTFLIPVFVVERRRLMTKDQLDQIRKRISADLHDDIGSNLGSISLIARTARKDLTRLQGPPQIAEDLSEMEAIARESSLAMRDIVWLLERRQDSIGDLVQRMRETAGRLLREIHFTLDCESHKTALKLSLDAKRHLFLFYKESIHNILKHSQADRVTIRLWDEGDQLILDITDNGIGIPINEGTAPAAVNKLTDRARVLNGNLKISSTKEAGTHIRLAVKRTHLIHSTHT